MDKNTPTTKPTESVDLDKLHGLLVERAGLDPKGNTFADIMSTVRAALARRAPAQQDADERTAFEIAMMAKGLSTARAAEEYGGAYRFVEKEWQGWQAARATQPVGQPATAREAELLVALQAVVDYHTKPAGLTPDVIKDKARFAAFMESVEQCGKAVVEQARAVLAGGQVTRPTDDQLWDETLRDRDTYHEWADRLAEAIAKHFDVEIGEHSNMNLPWSEALEVIESAAPVSAPGDERTGMRAAADFVYKRADQCLEENASTESDTGALVWRYGDAGRDYHSSLIELADDLRAAAPAAQAVEPAGKRAVAGCQIDDFSSKTCALGTNSCVSVHQPSAGQAAAGPVASSIDTPEFRTLLLRWESTGDRSRGLRSAEFDALIAHIDAKLSAAAGDAP